MTEPRWSSDDALLADLKEALARSGAGDESLLEVGRSAYTWRTVDEELAALTYDSLLDDRVLVRGATDVPRSMVFEHGAESLQVDVLADRIVGQLVPGGPGEVVVQSRTEDVARATTDAAGLFDIALAVRGLLVRFRCRTGSGPLVTDWVSI